MKYSTVIDKQALDFPGVRKQEAINRLLALPRHSLSNHTLSNGDHLAFYCTKKGRFFLYSRSKHSAPTDYKVYGTVSSYDGDARITVFKTKKNGRLGKLISAVVGALLIFFIMLLVFNFVINTLSLILFLGLSAIYVVPMLLHATDGDYQRVDAEIKYQELISIARTVSTWDEE